MQGKTKIELFENGKKVYEQMNKNMVTNYLNNAINPQCPYIRVATNGDPTHLNSALPLVHNMLGGILILSDERDEDPDKFIITAEDREKIVGRAGSPYSGDDTQRGTYNTNESGAIENGYRHVWDFGTDKANGNIACVGLTPKKFADLFPGSYVDDSYFGMIETNSFTDTTSYYLRNSLLSKMRIGSNRGETGGGLNQEDVGGLQIMHLQEDGNNLWLYGVAQRTGDIYKINIPNFSAVNLTDTVDSDLRSSDKIIKFYDAPAKTNARGCFYKNKFYICNTPTNSVIDIKIINLEGVLETSFSINPYKKLYSPAADLIYVPQVEKVIAYMNDSTTQMINKDGTLFHDLGPGTSKRPSGVIDLFGYLLVPGHDYTSSSTSYYNNFIRLDPLTGQYMGLERCASMHSEYAYPSYNNITADGLLPPYFMYACTYSSSSNNVTSFDLYLYLARFNHVIATINNLSSPVTKTAAQSMKITYEITN